MLHTIISYPSRGQAPKICAMRLNHGYTPSQVIGTAGNNTFSSTTAYGYWIGLNGLTWAVTSPINATTCTGTNDCTFTNLSTLSGAPNNGTASLNSIIVDGNNNLYVGGNVGTYGGMVFSLQNGKGSWTSVQLKSATGVADTGAVFLSISTTGSVIATTATASYNISL